MPLVLLLILAIIVLSYFFLILWIVSKALVLWIEKHPPTPTDEELRGCMREAVDSMFGIK